MSIDREPFSYMKQQV